MVSILRQIIKISLHWEQPSACFLEGVSSLLIGSLRNNDGDGYENVTWKVNSGCLKLNNAYSVSFNSSNVGSFFWSWIFIEGQEKKKKVFVWCSLSPQNVQWRQRNVQKSVIHVQSCCFANLNLLLFCRSRWRRHRRCISSGSLQRVFTWRHGGHIGVPKQWIGGHVGVPNQSCGS